MRATPLGGYLQRKFEAVEEYLCVTILIGLFSSDEWFPGHRCNYKRKYYKSAEEHVSRLADKQRVHLVVFAKEMVEKKKWCGRNGVVETAERLKKNGSEQEDFEGLSNLGDLGNYLKSD